MGLSRAARYAAERIAAAMPIPRARKAWQAMHDRCRNKNRSTYGCYGGRGITVCERWSSFDAFLADMGPAPEGRTLDRINNDGNYEPGNCRWATREEQDNNKRSNVIIEFRGKRLTIAQLARQQGMTFAQLYRRIHRDGWSVERAATAKLRNYPYYAKPRHATT